MAMTAAAADALRMWVQREYLGHELVPGGGVSTLSGAPGTHQDGAGLGETSREAAPWDRDPLSPVQAPTTDGAVTTAPRAPGGAAPSVQTPAVPAYGRTDTASADGPWLQVGRGGGLDVVLWAATGTALVITTVYAAVRVAQWHLLSVWGWSP